MLWDDQVYIEDLREEFVKDYVFWAVKVRVYAYALLCPLGWGNRKLDVVRRIKK